MIDTLKRMLPRALRIPPLSPEPYGLITLHRPSNVDDASKLRRMFQALESASELIPLHFPVHPRTAVQLRARGILRRKTPLHIMGPLSYLPFLSALARATLVLTDSGGIQEETTYLGIPCVTLRPNTERPITVSQGTNRLSTIDNLEETIEGMLAEKIRPECNIPLWDGQTAGRVVESIKNKFKIIS